MIVDLEPLVGGTIVVIVEAPGSPYIWTNQVGGMGCSHPEVRGVAIPTRFMVFKDILYDSTLRHLREEEVDNWLRAANLRDWFDPRSGIGGEAWVPVKVAGGVAEFRGRDAVITYANSD